MWSAQRSSQPEMSKSELWPFPDLWQQKNDQSGVNLGNTGLLW